MSEELENVKKEFKIELEKTYAELYKEFDISRENVYKTLDQLQKQIDKNYQQPLDNYKQILLLQRRLDTIVESIKQLLLILSGFLAGNHFHYASELLELLHQKFFASD